MNMLSKKTKKAIIFGLLGGVVGFAVAAVLFFVSFIMLIGFWGTPGFFPAEILITGIILSSLILILSTILRFKRFGILTSLIIFFISYIITIKVCRMQVPFIPLGARESSIFCAMVLIVPFLVWAMFTVRGIKIGLSLASKNNK